MGGERSGMSLVGRFMTCFGLDVSLHFIKFLNLGVEGSGNKFIAVDFVMDNKLCYLIWPQLFSSWKGR